MPKLLMDSHPPQPQPQPHHPSESTAPLPLFVPESNSKISNVSAFPDSTPAAAAAAATRFPSKLYFPFLAPFLFPSSSEKVYFLPKKDSWLVYFLFWCFNPSFLSFYCFMFSILLGMGGSYFSLAQWQELELQALIYRYMLAGAAVPPELLQPIKKSLLHSPPYFLHHPLQQYSYYQPACKCC